MEPPSPPRPRDSQRIRVYRAETATPSSPLPGLAACAAFIDRVVGTLWWQARFPDRTLDRAPYLRPGHGARQAFLREEEDGGHSIALPIRYRTKGVVLHELVHWGLHDQPDLPAHGQTFTRVLLDAIAEFCGAERADVLERAFRDHRVRVGDVAQCDVAGCLHYGADERTRLYGTAAQVSS
jgi:putative metallohydrolase (TIGR04338 family)